MKLKSSNIKGYIFLGTTLILTLLLFSAKNLIDRTAKHIETPDFKKKTNLDLIQITLSEKQHKKLLKKRNKALSIGTLETSDTDYVPALVSFNGTDYEADIRLKGDHLDHLKGDQWSFRIKLKGDKTILGMRKFSIHKPQTRLYINEWLYHKAIKKEKLFGLRYSFLEVGIHVKKGNSEKYMDKEVGIYAIEESFDKRTIESNNRKESVILKFSEDYWWKETKKSIWVDEIYALENKTHYMNPTLNLINRSPVTVFSEKKVMSDSTMHNYFKLSKNLLENLRQGKMTIDQVFDVKELAMQNAILNLFGARHGIAYINLRFYYNPITSKLEPIAFDGNPGVKLRNYHHFRFFRKKTDTIYLRELVVALNKVSKPEYLNKIISDNEKDLEYFKNVLNKEFNIKLLHIENFKSNQIIIKKELEILKKTLNITQMN